jgi:hypothetical protein
MSNKKQQSKNWEKYAEKAEDIYKNKTIIPGFPFNEKFPRRYGGQKYELILCNGEKCEARVDDSKEFSSEGLEWKLLTNTDNHSVNTNVERYVVLAWREI